MPNKVYLVIADGYAQWGCELFCAGIFSSEKAANEAKVKLSKEIYTTVHEVDLDKFYNMEKTDDGFMNELYLGGYVE